MDLASYPYDMTHIDPGPVPTGTTHQKLSGNISAFSCSGLIGVVFLVSTGLCHCEGAELDVRMKWEQLPPHEWRQASASTRSLAPCHASVSNIAQAARGTKGFHLDQRNLCRECTLASAFCTLHLAKVTAQAAGVQFASVN